MPLCSRLRVPGLVGGSGRGGCTLGTLPALPGRAAWERLCRGWGRLALLEAAPELFGLRPPALLAMLSSEELLGALVGGGLLCAAHGPELAVPRPATMLFLPETSRGSPWVLLSPGGQAAPVQSLCLCLLAVQTHPGPGVGWGEQQLQAARDLGSGGRRAFLPCGYWWAACSGGVAAEQSAHLRSRRRSALLLLHPQRLCGAGRGVGGRHTPARVQPPAGTCWTGGAGWSPEPFLPDPCMLQCGVCAAAAAPALLTLLPPPRGCLSVGGSSGVRVGPGGGAAN